MEYRRLGKSGLQVSALSLGSWLTFGKQIGDDTAEDDTPEDDGADTGLDDLDATQMLERVKDVTGNWFVDINDDLKDVKPATLLLIFGLGVLVGRLTS